MEEKIENFDICIVGGSIAGNYLCYLLSNLQLRIAVIEEHEQIGFPFQCAGIVSQKLSNLIDLPQELILNRVREAKIVAPSGYSIKLSGAEVPYIIDRIGLDCLFYKKVKNKENIIYFLGEKFISFNYFKENRERRISVKTTKRILKAKMLIGCDGPLSTVGRLLGISNKNLYATQIRVKASFNEDEAVMYFDPKWKELFGWIVPEGNHIYRVGMACSENLARNFRAFLKKLTIDEKYKIDQQGGLIPYGMMNKIAFNNILLLGDSAGQVKATTGGGIIMLLIAAKYAVNCIQKCFRHNIFSKKIIKKYYELPCTGAIGIQLKIHYIISKILEEFTDKDFIRIFRIIKASDMENYISLYGDMDFPKSLIFKMIKNPLFFTFLLKYIFKNPAIFITLIKILPK